MNRRRFLSVAAGSAATAAVASSVSCFGPFAKKPAPAALRIEVPTTCEMCVNKCSIIAVVENGRIQKLNPNLESPRSRGMVCARGNAGLQQVYDPSRLKRPLIRAGLRGEGKWRPVRR
jgi:thiosulfate reductase/polysulfide reductase chain A